VLNITNCFPEDEINKKLSQTFLFILFIDNQINSEDYKNPINSFQNMKTIPTSSSIFKNFFFKFSDVRYKSDDNLFFSSFEEKQTFKFSDVSENVDLRGDNTLFKGTFNQVNFIMADDTKIISRLYEKLSSSFAQIGGLAQAIILFTKFILYFWSENNILIYLISTIISDEEKEKFFDNENKNFNLNVWRRERNLTVKYEKKKENLKIKNNDINDNNVNSFVNNFNNDNLNNENYNFQNLNLKKERDIENIANSSNENFIKIVRKHKANPLNNLQRENDILNLNNNCEQQMKSIQDNSIVKFPKTNRNKINL
jgi:hypothetical protein